MIKLKLSTDEFPVLSHDRDEEMNSLELFRNISSCKYGNANKSPVGQFLSKKTEFVALIAIMFAKLPLLFHYKKVYNFNFFSQSTFINPQLGYSHKN